MIVTVTPLVVALLGLVLHHVATGKWSEDGRILFFCGMLAVLLGLGPGLKL
jgi:hypothetical protein